MQDAPILRGGEVIEIKYAQAQIGSKCAWDIINSSTFWPNFKPVGWKHMKEGGMDCQA